MKELVGKKIRFTETGRNGKTLFYTATVKAVVEGLLWLTHVTFIPEGEHKEHNHDDLLIVPGLPTAHFTVKP